MALERWWAISRLLGMGALFGAADGAGAQSAYIQHNLVSDLPGLASNRDPNLLNPWGWHLAGPDRFG